MPLLPIGGTGSGGGGLTLGPPTNSFTAATQADAEDLRDAYELANAAWLAQYDNEPTYTIQINWPVVVTDSLYQSRRGGDWADVTGLIRGEPGARGALGAQGRFMVYCYINAAVAPAAAPASTTFERSTGTLLVPAGYAAIPSTPVAGSETYRSEAIVNPATDIDLVDLAWSLPAELPAYAVVTLAVAAKDAAEAAQARAEQSAGQAVDIPAGSPRGELLATSPTLPTAATGTNSVIAFGAAELWTVEANAPDGFEAGPAANNERLYLPDIHPAGSNGIWLVVEVDDVEVAEVFISHGGIQGATGADRRLVLPVSLTADALIRTGFWPRSGATAAYIQLTGNSDTLPADTVVKVYLAVVRGAPGGGGGPGGPHPFTDEDRVKLDGIEEGATNVSEADINTLIQAALGTALTGDQTGITATLNADGTIDFVVAGVAPPADHTRRSAISDDAALSDAQAAAGESSNTSTITTPDWGDGVFRTLYLGVPEDEDDISDITSGGLSTFASYEAYLDAMNQPIIVDGHKWWRTVDTQDGEFAANQDLEIVQ